MGRFVSVGFVELERVKEIPGPSTADEPRIGGLLVMAIYYYYYSINFYFSNSIPRN